MLRVILAACAALALLAAAPDAKACGDALFFQQGQCVVAPQAYGLAGLGFHAQQFHHFGAAGLHAHPGFAFQQRFDARRFDNRFRRFDNRVFGPRFRSPFRRGFGRGFGGFGRGGGINVIVR